MSSTLSLTSNNLQNPTYAPLVPLYEDRHHPKALKRNLNFNHSDEATKKNVKASLKPDTPSSSKASTVACLFFGALLSLAIGAGIVGGVILAGVAWPIAVVSLLPVISLSLVGAGFCGNGAYFILQSRAHE